MLGKIMQHLALMAKNVFAAASVSGRALLPSCAAASPMHACLGHDRTLNFQDVVVCCHVLCAADLQARLFLHVHGSCCTGVTCNDRFVNLT